jgi:hypothetical protein
VGQQRRGKKRRAAPRRPWTPEENQLVRTLPPSEVARRTGRSYLAVYMRRRELGVDPHR